MLNLVDGNWYLPGIGDKLDINDFEEVDTREIPAIYYPMFKNCSLALLHEDGLVTEMSVIVGRIEK